MTRIELKVLIACRELIKNDIYPNGTKIAQKLHVGAYSKSYFGRIKGKLIREGLLKIPEILLSKKSKETEYDDKEIQKRIEEIRLTKIDSPRHLEVEIKIVKDPRI